jgi:hypothetical protein
MLKRLLAICASLMVTACASSYTPDTLTGGYSEQPLQNNAWQVRYGGNGFTTDETVQTYWLYHCAEFALSKGFEGFTIMTPVNLSAVTALHRPDSEGEIIKVHSSGGGGGHVYVYSYGSTAQMYKPWITANIQLLHKPFTPVPGKTFDAAALKALLEPHVMGPKCNGNVCPYVHSYLFPPATAN